MNNIELDNQSILNFLRTKIRNIPDFPIPGIQYKDITPLLQDAKALKYTTYLLTCPFQDKAIDKVASLESRGFLLGPSIAQNLEAGFVPIRKEGKLPSETISTSYKLEYGYNTIEINKDAIEPGERVLIHDDLLATGGSVAAASKLISQLKGQVIGYSFIIELEELGGRQHLDEGALIERVHSL